jgi:Tfp pilus assembly protein PilN
MINLLPPELKQEYHYARRNKRLVRWALVLVVAIAGVAVITGSGLVVMSRSVEKNKSDIAKVKADLDRQNIDGVQREVTVISANLRLMVNVLSKEILFSKLLVQLGNATPSAVILTNLSISQTSTAIDLTARAIDYGSAAQLQANLAAPENKIFSKADIVNISCSDSKAEGVAANYPCSVTIKALFAEDNQFQFISDGKKAGQ